MVLEPRLVQSQVQQLILSPQMQQALHLLQLPLMDLKQILQQEIVQNPVLEEVAPSDQEPTEAEKELLDQISKLAQSEEEWEEYFQDASDLGTVTADQEKRDFFEASITGRRTLQSHLLSQVHVSGLPERRAKLAEIIIGNVNDDGYLEATLHDVAVIYVLDELKEEAAAAAGCADARRVERYLRMTAASDARLHRYLLWQLSERELPEQERKAALLIIRAMDEHGVLRKKVSQLVEEADGLPSGYLDAMLELIRALDPEGVACTAPSKDLAARVEAALSGEKPFDRVDAFLEPIKDEAERVLRFVQRLDPIGCGSRDLRECLLLQLELSNELDGLPATIIREHLEDLERNRYPQIAKALKVSIEDVKAAAERIGRLVPKPGHAFSSAPAQYIVPDVIVEKVDDEYQIIINDGDLPRLRVSPMYRQLLAQAQTSEKAREYIMAKLRSAMWLIRSIEQRRRTIYKVTECIIQRQREFLEKGIQYLKPLKLSEVAEMAGLHESTVSRVTTNKYVQTPIGIFELKFFFSRAVETEGPGEATSAKSVKARIREIIEGEDKRKPYTDGQITKILAMEGVKIARRTVAKYREELGILSASLRKEY